MCSRFMKKPYLQPNAADTSPPLTYLNKTKTYKSLIKKKKIKLLTTGGGGRS